MNKRFKFLYQNGLVIKLILFISFVPGFVFAESEGTHTEPDYIGLLFVFILSTFIGLGVVTRVSRLLHTPLMSLTNAISAIAVVGSLILTGHNYPDYITLLGSVALFASMTNIVSGFLITDRMLKMFKSKETKKS
jgi:NAD(P) transhydrogenase subunit alpha